MILTVSQMQQLEHTAFEHGIKPSDLMEEAGVGIGKVVEQFFPTPGTCIVYCGKGHNGGDALAAAYYLGEKGWKILVRLAFPEEELAPLTRSHLQALSAFAQEVDFFSPSEFSYPLVQLDGLLGIGSQGAPRESIAILCEEMNQLRREKAACTVAMDVPSGLNGTTGIPTQACVQADLTVTIGFAKTGLVADGATHHVGRLAVVPLAELTAEVEQHPIESSAEVASPEKLRLLLPSRDFDVNKGMFGRVGIIAGSRGYLGAARLASRAALQGGGGLVTLYVLEENYELLATSCVPEVMVKPISKWSDVLSGKLDALVIGPGLGSERHEEILEIVEQAACPCVVDADALNAVSKKLYLLLTCKGPRLLTPHPGEMERLFPNAGRDRKTWALDFINRYPVTLLLKGSRTIVAEKGTPISFNTTGNPGMASGGMGDVLSGVLGSFLARGILARDAAVLGAWLCGRAAEIAIYSGTASEEALVATDVIDYLGNAMNGARQGSY